MTDTVRPDTPRSRGDQSRQVRPGFGIHDDDAVRRRQHRIKPVAAQRGVIAAALHASFGGHVANQLTAGFFCNRQPVVLDATQHLKGLGVIQITDHFAAVIRQGHHRGGIQRAKALIHRGKFTGCCHCMTMNQFYAVHFAGDQGVIRHGRWRRFTSRQR